MKKNTGLRHRENQAKHRIFIAAGLILVAVLWGSPDGMADTIGFIDMQKISKSYPAARAAEEAFQKQYQEFQQLAQTKQKQIDDAKSKGKSEAELQKLNQSIQDELKPKQQTLMGLQQDLVSRLQGDVVKATKAIAKQYGIDVVLQKEAVLTGGFDLTEFVLEKLNTK